MTRVPDLVRLSKLETQFHSDPPYTQHIDYVSRSSQSQRSVRREEKWKRERKLGQGGFGLVWVEQCIQGDSTGELRAVKKIQKRQVSDDYRELEAIALFSHAKYEQCFVKSFGWYDDEDNIFIAMEYLPHGDLHQYLTSPLPEQEGQQIVSQILEGLQFMHEIGFAHRDLKPANILIVCRGPAWWVKIADFGISKRAIEGLTMLRTQIGTPAFAAPEVLGYCELDDTSNDSYTNAVDIWSLGVIAFLILTGEVVFKSQRRLNQYVIGSFTFPLDVLLANKVSAQGGDFVKSLLAAKSEDRPTVEECLNSPWLRHLAGALDTQREFNLSNSPQTLVNHLEHEASASWITQDQIRAHETHRSIAVLAEDNATPNLSREINLLNHSELEIPSASWSTPDQISAHETHRSMAVFAEENATPTSTKLMAGSTIEPAIQTCWKLRKKLKGHSQPIWAVKFSPDGKQIASASDDKTVRLWDSATGAELGTLSGHSHWVYALAFSPNGKQIASASRDKTVRLWGSATGAARGTLKGHSDRVYALAFSPDGKQIASASADETVRLWDSATGAALGTLKGHSMAVYAVAFSPDGKQIASASTDKTVRLWDSATWAALGTLKGHSDVVEAVAFSPDGKQIASASDDETVRLWDSATGAALGTLKGHSDYVYAVAFSPDGKQIASASVDKTVRLWDSATGAALGTLKGHSDSVLGVAFSPDGKQIASASRDKTVRLWESATGAALSISVARS